MKNYLTDNWLTDKSNNCPTVSPTSWLIELLINWLTVWLTDCLLFFSLLFFSFLFFIFLLFSLVFFSFLFFIFLLFSLVFYSSLLFSSLLFSSLLFSSLFFSSLFFSFLFCSVLFFSCLSFLLSAFFDICPSEMARNLMFLASWFGNVFRATGRAIFWHRNFQKRPETVT